MRVDWKIVWKHLEQNLKICKGHIHKKSINPKYVCIHVRTGRAYKKKKSDKDLENYAREK